MVFKSSRKTELDWLLKDGTFLPVHESKIKGQKQIFGSRFFYELKKLEDDINKNSSLVAVQYAEEDSTYILKKGKDLRPNFLLKE